MKSASEPALRARAARRGLKLTRIGFAWKRPEDRRAHPFYVVGADGATQSFASLKAVAAHLDRFDRGEA